MQEQRDDPSASGTAASFLTIGHEDPGILLFYARRYLHLLEAMGCRNTAVVSLDGHLCVKTLELCGISQAASKRYAQMQLPMLV